MVIQLGLAFWQWAKPNIVIPIIFLLLTIYGLLTAALGIANNGLGASETAASPVWNLILGLVVMALAALFHASGIRGAAALGKYKIRD